MNEENIILQLEGNTNDLLMVDENNVIKATRLFYLNSENGFIDENDEVIDISVTSTNIFKSHDIFDKIIDKKIRLTLEIIDK